MRVGWHRAVETTEGSVLDVAQQCACLLGRSGEGEGEGEGRGLGRGRGLGLRLRASIRLVYRIHIAVVLKALLKPQPGCAPSTSTGRPAGDTTKRCMCGSGEVVKRSVASTAKRLSPRCSTSRHSRTLKSCARRDPYRLGVSHHCCRGSRAGRGTGSSSSVAGTGLTSTFSGSMGCTSTHGKPNSLADAPSFSSAGAYAADATVATTVLLVAQRRTSGHIFCAKLRTP